MEWLAYHCSNANMLSMAQCVRFVCDSCGNSVTAWDDGNPYYFAEEGKKAYAYHPDSMRERCIGNDVPHPCLGCGDEFRVDSNAPTCACPKCGHPDIADTSKLDGRRCPACESGVFHTDPEFFVIS